MSEEKRLGCIGKIIGIWLRCIFYMGVLLLPACLVAFIGGNSGGTADTLDYIYGLLMDSLEALPFSGVLLSLGRVLAKEQALHIDWMYELIKLAMMIPMYSFTAWVIAAILRRGNWFSDWFRRTDFLKSAVFYSANMIWVVFVSLITDRLYGSGMRMVCIAAAVLILLFWLGAQLNSMIRGRTAVLAALKDAAFSGLGMLPLYVITSLMGMMMDARLDAVLRFAGFAVLVAVLWFYFEKKDSPLVLGCFFVLGLLLYCGWDWVIDVYERFLQLVA